MQSRSSERIRIPLRVALLMIASYAWRRIRAQIRSVAFVVLYLVAFQSIILDVPVVNALSVAGGVAMVILGLAFFLEGLLLGLMPLGERVGIKIPLKGGLGATVGFGLLVGLGATFAEPAIAALRTAGALVTAWDTPLLFMLLERRPDALFIAIGIGVGIAVALGMVRFYYGFSIKPFVFIIVPLVLAASAAMLLDENLSAIVGLAWDTGAITTGPVTVPIVLALGIGVSRAAGKSEMAGAGFGVIMLASILPVLTVLTLGLMLNRSAPSPASEQVFFSPAHRAHALKIFEREEDLAAHAFRRGSEAGRRALHDDEAEYLRMLAELGRDGPLRRRILGTMSLAEWLERQASDSERERFSDAEPDAPAAAVRARLLHAFADEARLAFRAVFPLALLLLLTLMLYLRERPRYTDEVLLGIVLALLGMMSLATGIQLGLTPLGAGVGRHLPRVLQGAPPERERVVLHNFDESLVFEGIAEDGSRSRFFYLHSETDAPRLVEFDEERFDPTLGRYVHEERPFRRAPWLHQHLLLLGVGLVFVFAFGIGFGSTLAEPALNAMGHTVQELTAGAITQTTMVRVVAVGVGAGLVAGMARIIYDFPIMWLLAPSYLALIPLTLASAEDFAGIAWDSGGVTTGVVTVPLVLAMGLGIGNILDVADGFGVLAMASVFPIISVLLYGLFTRVCERCSTREAEG